MPSLKPVRITVNVPAALVPLIRQRKGEEHLRSDSAYFLSLALFDLVSRCRHKLTAQMVNEPTEMLDRIVEEIVRDFAAGTRRNSDWLRHRIEELQAESEGTTT